MNQVLKQIEKEIKSCTSCDLYKTKREYVPGIIGSKFPRLIFLGEAPGAYEDIHGVPFCGQSGNLLTEAIEEVFKIHRGEYTILNTVKCRPPQNRDPSAKEKKRCSKHLFSQIKALKPCIIITLGKHAGNTFSKDPMAMKDLKESYFADEKGEIRVIPCYHPSYILRNRTQRGAFLDEFRKIANGDYAQERTLIRRNILPPAAEDIDGCGIVLSPGFNE